MKIGKLIMYFLFFFLIMYLDFIDCNICDIDLLMENRKV